MLRISTSEDGHPIADMPVVSDPAEEIDILQGMAHGFGSASDLGEASAWAVQWVRTVVGSPSAARVALPDRSGRLRTMAARGEDVEAGRKRSARRRRAFATKQASLHRFRRPPGGVLAIFPLVSRGEAVGVLEVTTPGSVIEKRWRTLEAVASQAAIVVRNLRRLEGMERRIESLEAAADLVRELLVADSVRSAVLSMIRLSYRLHQAPIAAWAADEDPTRLRFLGVRGMGNGKRAAIRSAFPILPRWDLLNGTERRAVADQFAETVGAEKTTVIAAEEAVILVAGEPAAANGYLVALGSLFRDALGRLGALATAQRRSEGLDLGIAYTAHEVRTPLLGAKATIEHVLEEAGPQVVGHELLSRSREELGELAVMVDALLRWAVGQEPLRRRPTDLVRVVREAIGSRPVPDQARVRLSAPAELPLRADPAQLRSAVANLVGNALSYSPAGTEVLVSVERVADGAAVIVRDDGPGIPHSERESMFDPLVRGTAGRSARRGKGLGLFIARRVVEAHGGAVSLEPTDRGATFRIELPAEGNGANPHR